MCAGWRWGRYLITCAEDTPRPHCGQSVIYKMHSDSISNISEAGWKVHGSENYYLVLFPMASKHPTPPRFRSHFKRRIMIQSGASASRRPNLSSWIASVSAPTILPQLYCYQLLLQLLLHWLPLFCLLDARRCRKICFPLINSWTVCFSLVSPQIFKIRK